VPVPARRPPPEPASWIALARTWSGWPAAWAAATTRRCSGPGAPGGQRPRPSVAGLLHAEVGTDPATGKPTLTWHFDQAALAAEQATDGW
jgi:hypothetical protein